MFLNHLKQKFLLSIRQLQIYTDRSWYPIVISFLSAIDNIILIIPNDGILISSSMLRPKKWFLFTISITVGSTLGALLLAALVEHQGLPWILKLYPGIESSKSWILMHSFFEKYGLLMVFFVALAPIVQQPAIILASIANTPLLQLCIIVFIGRFIKFMIMSYLASHAPKVLSRLWGLKEEMSEVGIKVNSDKSA